LLLNPDVTVAAGFLEHVLDIIDWLPDGAPDVGVMGFGLRHSDGSPQGSSGPFPTLTGTLGGLARPRACRKYRPPPSSGRTQVPWVTGCCVLLRRACLQQVGGFDPDYFLYYEDVDFCCRARARGWSIWYEPALQAVHHHPLHARRVPTSLRVITRHALLTYAAKHWPGWQFSCLTLAVRIEAAVRQWWARCQEDWRRVARWGELGALAADLAHGRTARARRRLERVVRREERRRAC
jgi:GT2 family glycosyltransferase